MFTITTGFLPLRNQFNPSKATQAALFVVLVVADYFEAPLTADGVFPSSAAGVGASNCDAGALTPEAPLATLT